MTLSERVQARAEERRWLILGVLCFSLLVIVLDNSILNVALPSIVRELDATNTQLQWIVDSYTLVFAGLLLTAGSLGDRFGRRPALQVGFALFGLGSLASAMSTTPNMLIFSRAFMGIGGAFIMPATLSIITNVFPTRERGKAIGIWAATAGLGAALGPLTGGFLLEHFYWGSVFLVNLPIVIFGLVAGVFLIPDSKDPSAPRLDPVGAVLSIVGLAMVLFAIIEAPRNGWTDPVTVVCFLVGAAVLAGLRLVGAPLRPPDARLQLLPQPALQRGQLGDHPDVLRHVRLAVPLQPVPAVRAGLHTAPDRHPAPGRRHPDDDRRPALAAVRPPVRHEVRGGRGHEPARPSA